MTGRGNISNAPKAFNDRAKALGINVEINIDLTRRGYVPSEHEEEKLRAALLAAHEAILISLESSGFTGADATDAKESGK